MKIHSKGNDSMDQTLAWAVERGALAAAHLGPRSELRVWAALLAGNTLLAAAALACGLLGILAPYGGSKAASPYAALFGPRINSKLGWYVMELPALLSALAVLGVAAEDGGGVGHVGGAFLRLHGPARIAALCFLLHYFNRAVLFPAKRGDTNAMEPVGTFVLGAVFNSANGYCLMRYLTHFGPAAPLYRAHNTGTGFTVVSACGLCVFGFGAYVNIRADGILLEMSKRRGRGGTAVKGHTRQPKYSAPTGFWAFDYCTCPNYLGELLEWAGFALMTWPSPASLCFLWMTFCNLYPRARDRHRRYCEQLPGYQALGRTAVIPFLL